MLTQIPFHCNCQFLNNSYGKSLQSFFPENPFLGMHLSNKILKNVISLYEICSSTDIASVWWHFLKKKTNFCLIIFQNIDIQIPIQSKMYEQKRCGLSCPTLSKLINLLLYINFQTIVISLTFVTLQEIITFIEQILVIKFSKIK